MRKPLVECFILFAVTHLLGKVHAYRSYDYSTGTMSKSQLVIGSCIFGAYCCAGCIKVVSTGDECLVERLGKFHRKLKPGLNFVVPFIDIIRFRDTLREQVLDVPPQECFTFDNAPLTVDAIVYMRITDMKDACYEVSDVKNAVLNLCLTNVREEVGRITLEESFSSRGDLNRKLVATLNGICRRWGVEITRVEIQHLQPSPEILRSMELQMSAERKKRAAILQSEGEKTKLINEAEGRAGAMLADAEARKKSIILASQAEAERQEIEAEGIKLAIHSIATAIAGAGGRYYNQNGQLNENSMRDALQLLSLVRYLETQGKFASQNGTKVLMFPTKDRYVPLIFKLKYTLGFPNYTYIFSFLVVNI